MNKFIYLDYAATTPVDQRVVKVMEPYWYRNFGNPSSLHQAGIAAREVLEESRQKIMGAMGWSKGKIVFTSGGTEADNLAVSGTARANVDRGKHIIISSIEHKAVLYPANYLKHNGWEVDICPVDEAGLIDLAKLTDLVRPDTVLVSIIYANNEIGSVQDMAAIGRAIRQKNERTIFHTDACQAINFLPMEAEKLGVDMLTFNGSKCYGPKGVGGLYFRDGIKIEPILFGGGQENGLRPGTENLPLIVGMAEAIKLARQIFEEENRRLFLYKQKIISTIEKEIKGAKFNGSRNCGLPNIINFSFPGVEGESLVLYLDQEGFGVSTGSACSAADLDPSHVLLAIGLSKEMAHTSLRISLGRWTGEDGVNQFIETLPKVVDKVRKMSAIDSSKN